MRNQRGGVKLITLVAIVIVLTLILFTIVFIKHYSKENGNVEQTHRWACNSM